MISRVKFATTAITLLVMTAPFVALGFNISCLPDGHCQLHTDCALDERCIDGTCQSPDGGAGGRGGGGGSESATSTSTSSDTSTSSGGQCVGVIKTDTDEVTIPFTGVPDAKHQKVVGWTMDGGGAFTAVGLLVSPTPTLTFGTFSVSKNGEPPIDCQNSLVGPNIAVGCSVPAGTTADGDTYELYVDVGNVDRNVTTQIKTAVVYVEVPEGACPAEIDQQVTTVAGM